ncbi:MAG: DMT family transporter [Rhizobiaceae bacterium]|nr:DMT family transporter [Rhizobiaceae bacterium]
MALSPNLRGALFMSISMAGFTVNDAIAKAAATEMNMAQVMAIRGVFATTLVALFAWHQGALRAPRMVLDPMVLLRSFSELGATLSFLMALTHMPLGTVSAILQALPLAVTMGAALVFGERVRWRRWAAIVAGFCGVLIVVRPGFEGFSPYALFALACVFFAAVRDLATKRVPDHIPSLLVTTVTATLITVAGLVLIVPFGGWTPVGAGSVARLACAGVLLLVGYQFIIMAMRTGEISFIAPFRYTALLWAIVLGYLAFGEAPDIAMIAGSMLVVGSGLYTLYRERVVGSSRIAAESVTTEIAPDRT